MTDLQELRYEELESQPELGLYTYPTRPSRADQANFFAGLEAGILESRMVCNVADDAGTIVGHASVFPKGEHREVRHIGSLGLVVRREYRGKGLGSRLLARTLSDCTGKFEIVELSVTATNEAARRLYLWNGFEERGRLPRSFKRGSLYLDEIIMSRVVEPAGSG